MQTRATIEGREVVGMESGNGRGRHKGGAEIGIDSAEVGEDGIEDEGARCIMSQKLPERDGVGRIAVENSLIDIESTPDDASPDVLSAELVLNEDAGNFAVIHINVVWPFD